MAINSIGEYPEIITDAVENFNGNQLLILDWDDHRGLGGCPSLVPVPPEMLFSTVVSDVMPGLFSAHPDWKNIDWASVKWTLDGKAFSPESGKSLVDNGVGHKSMIRFKTPGLNGYMGTLN
jgi:phenol hydroxylase P4 protein